MTDFKYSVLLYIHIYRYMQADIVIYIVDLHCMLHMPNNFNAGGILSNRWQSVEEVVFHFNLQ